MRNRTLAIVVALTMYLLSSRQALAGDGATIIMKSGVIITIVNGYNQLVAGMKSLKSSGAENYPVEVSIEGTSFFINLGAVALICRDKCDSMTISYSKQAAMMKGER